MDIHKPKPVHSWREFLNEITIIIIGVLIALGLEQAVEQWHWHGEVAEARESLREELSGNLAAFRFGLANSTCAVANLEQFEKLVQARNIGAVKAAMSDGTWQKLGLWQFKLTRTVWDTINASGLMAHMPAHERLEWAGGYAVIINEDMYKTANWHTVLDLIAKGAVYDGSPEASRALLNDASAIALFQRARVRLLWPDFVTQSSRYLGLKHPADRADKTQFDCRPLRPNGSLS